MQPIPAGGQHGHHAPSSHYPGAAQGAVPGIKTEDGGASAVQFAAVHDAQVGRSTPDTSAPLPPPQPRIGFTPTQLSVLRNQIVAFKTLKSHPASPLPSDVLAGVKPPPLDPSPANGDAPSTTSLTAALPGAPVAASAAAHAPTSAQGTAHPPAGPAGSTAGTAAAAAGPSSGQAAVSGGWAPGAAAAGPTRSPSPAVQPQQRPLQPQHPQQQQQQQQQPRLSPQPLPSSAAGEGGLTLQQYQQHQAQLRQASATPPPAAATPPAVEAQPPLSSRRHQGPVYTITAGAGGKAQQPPKASPGQPGWHMMGFDAASLLQSEYRRLLDRRRADRVAELLAAKAAACNPGFQYRSEKVPIGRVELELRKLRLVGRQAAVRAAVEAEQQELLALPERRYQNLRRGHRSSKIEMARKDIQARAERGLQRARDAKSHRQVMGEEAGRARDLRVARNRGITRAHERLSREHNKLKGDDRAMRLEALKAHDFEAYQELLRQQTGVAAGSGEKFEAISKFLHDTEEYLHRLAGKIASVKLSAEASKAAARAISEARAKGLSEEEVQAAATAAAQDAANSSSAMVKEAVGEGGDAQSHYYKLAHSAQEDIADQPTLLRPPKGAKLREYQMVGLRWMVSLYNNHLNGILADEMGLGKTVQVMSLIAYLMERKSNFGPHLIIVPNAVLVNWKAELTLWLPSVRCVYYTGNKEERARKYAQEVQSLQFNVLVTTYEFIMRDRTKLAKVDWQYIVIDEAQRMKDRQSKLARDLDRFNAQRRLLLSGTPLQNDLQELWSLLNLLLPEVFDDKKMFAEWFGESFSSTQGGGEGGADWLEMEKRVVVIHRLHQILEPFMLRRQVEDVESKLPPKIALVVKVPMTPYQSTIYEWVKATGTIRLDPSVPMPGRHKRAYASLNNKCMELRKVCNHPMLSYPPPSYAVGEAIVRQCGKLVTLDPLLVKLKAAGHRVLLFSTMTRLLDLMEVYLQWRTVPPENQKMKYLRIDGSTSLDARESAIQQFNAPDSDAFIFLLSIRAAGRGLNLQSSDTVVIYDPDPNPKNEEQAIARSHRIGQSKEVRVIHLEAIADTPRPPPPPPGQPPPPRLYADSIESLVRNQIQKLKIDMANEVIDAGRFDMQTSMEERKQTLESLLQDEDRLKRSQNEAPSYRDLNRQLARGEHEYELFQKMDQEMKWLEPTPTDQLPPWLRWGREELLEAMSTSKHKPDVAAELAALTGTVLHHHQQHPQHNNPQAQPAAAAGAAAGGRPGRPPGVRPQVPAAQALAALAAQREQAEAAAAAAAAAGSAQAGAAAEGRDVEGTAKEGAAVGGEGAAVGGCEGEGASPAVTVTTTRGSAGAGMDEEDEEVTMAEMGGDDEEEEILEENIAIEDLTTEGPSDLQHPPQQQGMKRVPSTAVTSRRVPTPGNTETQGGSEGEVPSPEEVHHAKRRKGLSVHFVDTVEEDPLGGDECVEGDAKGDGPAQQPGGETLDV